MSSRIQPIIKWSGSKRLQAPSIVRFFPSFSTYYEPFVGGGSVLFQANPTRAICGDICEPLIEFWNVVKANPKGLIESYAANWNKLRTQGHTYYYEVRDRFNSNPNAFDLLFLSRTCVNGLIRFNRAGQFNNSLHHTRKGIHPSSMAKIILAWANRISNVQFVKGDYRDSTKSARRGDFIYLDPPYFNTKGRYYGRLDFDEFLEYLQELNERGIRFALSFDGARGNKDFIVVFPKGLLKRHVMISNGNSTFRKVMDAKIEKVRESLYVNWLDPKTELVSYSRSAGLSNLSSVEANLVALKTFE